MAVVGVGADTWPPRYKSVHAHGRPDQARCKHTVPPRCHDGADIDNGDGTNQEHGETTRTIQKDGNSETAMEQTTSTTTQTTNRPTCNTNQHERRHRNGDNEINKRHDNTQNDHRDNDNECFVCCFVCCLVLFCVVRCGNGLYDDARKAQQRSRKRRCNLLIG